MVAKIYGIIGMVKLFLFFVMFYFCFLWCFTFVFCGISLHHVSFNLYIV